MTTAMPQVFLDNDPDRAMSVHGLLMGFSRQRAVWRFGFPPGSLMANAFGVSALAPLWALTIHRGTVIETYTGPWAGDPPSPFKNVLVAKL